MKSIKNPVFSFTSPDDFHVHVRQGECFSDYVQATASHFERALIMPNITPGVRTVQDVRAYKRSILDITQKMQLPFTPLMTCKLYESHTAKNIMDLKKEGVVACKLYPRGATTNAEDGVKDVKKLSDIFKAMADCSMILCIHGENPDSFVLEREYSFLDTLSFIRSISPYLKIVLEHVSDARVVEYIKADTSLHLAATVTVHHLLYTLDDVIGQGLNPHFFCKPILKCPRDRNMLQDTVLSGNPKFFLGTDSAPHMREKKECAYGCAGVYSTPVAMALLACFFSSNSNAFNTEPDVALLKSHSEPLWVRKLENFCSVYGRDFYKLEKNTTKLLLKKSSWKVPHELHGVVPLCAGEILPWMVERKI